MENMEPTSACSHRLVNRELLPIKLHYILLFGAAAGVAQFLPVLGKQLGLSATAVGLVYTAQRIGVFIAQPTFGALADYTRNLKMVMISMIIVYGICLAGILFISPIHHMSSNEGIATICFNNTPMFYETHQYNESCINFELRKNTTCEFQFFSCVRFDTFGVNAACNETCGIPSNERGNDLMANIYMSNGTSNGKLLHKKMINAPVNGSENNHFIYDFHYIYAFENGSDCNCKDSTENAVSCSTDQGTCMLKKDIKDSVYRTYQFWTFSILVIATGSSMVTLCILSDATCCELLCDKESQYGNQRLFGTLSWGMTTLLVGYMNTSIKMRQANTDYEPGFYFTFSILFVDMILLSRMRLKKANFTSTICKDIGRIINSAEMLAFFLAVFIIGGLSGLLWSYELWFLESLGANQFLMGLTIFVQCIMTEVPFLYISNFMIRTFGHFFCLVGTFAAFCLRCILYSFLRNPWLVLPIELLHGQTYGNFQANMISFGKIKAPPGTEATMLGLLGGMFEGLGTATGGLLGGLGFDTIGDRLTFLSAGLLSGVCAIIFLVISLVLKQCERSKPNIDSAKVVFENTDM